MTLVAKFLLYPLRFTLLLLNWILEAFYELLLVSLQRLRPCKHYWRKARTGLKFEGEQFNLSANHYQVYRCTRCLKTKTVHLGKERL